MPTKVQTKVPTGREKVRRFLVIGSRRIQLSFVEKAHFPCYDILMEEKQLKLTENTPLPVKLVTERYVEYTPKDLSLIHILGQGHHQTVQIGLDIGHIGRSGRRNGAAIEGDPVAI